MARMNHAEIIAEVEWLIEGGMHPLYIADALGRSEAALYKLCWRHGRNDLANLFGRQYAA